MAVSADTRVADAETVLHLLPPTVSPSDTLGALVSAVAVDPRARCAFVVGADSRLLGVVPESDLDQDLALLLAPEASTAEQTGPKVLARVARGANETAEHLMRTAVTVGTAERLDSAVHRMRAGAQETAAVVDEEGRLLGYLSLFEVLSAFLEAGGAGL
ncbi:MAG: CBS domain-containing protein [Candidatus Dormiibacterota bacterium]